MLRKLLKIVLVVFIVLVVAIIAIPYFFKDKIMAIVKTELNKQLNAKVDFRDVDISLIRHFPRLAVGLEELQVINIAPFEGDTLLAVKKVDAALNLMSVIKGDRMEIYNVALEQPRVHAIVHSNGDANWDITKPDTTQADMDTAAAQPFSMSLQRYKIEDAYIHYDDQQGNMQMIVDHLTHEGKGDFTQDLFTLSTRTTADAVTFRYGLIPYLSRAAAKIDADIEIDNRSNTYTFRNGKVLLNNLELALQGFCKLVNDSTYGMDMSFKAPSTNFKDLLSLVPAVYQQDFGKIKTEGTAAFDGFVKGTYSATQMPAFAIHLAVKNGFFQYPDLPKPVKNIQLTVNVNNPDGVPDHTVVDMPAAHLEMDNTPLDLRLLIKTPVSDMYVDGAARGKLDLSKITQFVKLEEGTRLTGLLDADISAKGNMSAIEKQQYDKFYAAGRLLVNNLLYRSKDYPDGVKVNNLSLQFNPRNVSVQQFNGQYMGTNFQASGEVNNLLAYMFKSQPLDGHLAVKADNVDLDKWMGTTSTTAAEPPADSAAATPFVVPGNLDFGLQAQVDKVHYDKLDLTNLTGNLRIKDETVTLEQVKGNALQGTMEVSGSYSTKQSRQTPDINLSYNVQELDVQQTFNAFNTVQKLMPIGRFLSGKITSRLNLQGKLGKDMMPVLSTLDGEGSLLLIEGFLKKFAPIDQLANQLNVSQLKDISLRDIKSYFSFEDGRVKVSPFTVRLANINMAIAGSHGFDQSLDYTLQLALPRSIMGQQANSLVDNLVTQASNKGIPVNVSDSVHLQVLLGGNITKPTYKTDLQETASRAAEGLKDQAAALVKSRVDSAKSAAKDSLQQVTKNAASALKDQLSKQLGGEKDTTGQQKQNLGKEAEQTLKNTLKGIFKKKES